MLLESLRDAGEYIQFVHDFMLLLYILSFVSLASPDEAILRKRYSLIANKSFPATYALLKYSRPPGSTIRF